MYFYLFVCLLFSFPPKVVSTFFHPALYTLSLLVRSISSSNWLHCVLPLAGRTLRPMSPPLTTCRPTPPLLSSPLPLFYSLPITITDINMKNKAVTKTIITTVNNIMANTTTNQRLPLLPLTLTITPFPKRPNRLRRLLPSLRLLLSLKTLSHLLSFLHPCHLNLLISDRFPLLSNTSCPPPRLLLPSLLPLLCYRRITRPS